MTFHPLTQNEMSRYEAVLNNYQRQILSIPHVRGVGVGYRHRNGKLVPEVTLVVVVTREYDPNRLAAGQRVKASYGWVETDIVRMPAVENHAAGVLPVSKRFQPVDPLIGGIQIGNSKLCKNVWGVLGAVVYDKKTGAPLGLSVQHAIGTSETPRSQNCDCSACQRAKEKTTGKGNPIKSWWIPAARTNDPISQPNSSDSQNQIGTLLKFDAKYDAAIFQLNSNRQCEPKINGLPGEIGEPTKATLGTLCRFAGAKTHTKGRIWFVGKLRGDERLQVSFDILSGCPRTAGGDSGGIWVTSDGLHPIGLHTGQITATGYAIATSIQQLVEKFHPFTFQPVQYEKLVLKTSQFETEFVKAPKDDGFFTFCGKSATATPVKITRYNHLCKPLTRGKSDSQIDALSGISAVAFKDKIYATWRSMARNQVKLGIWDHSGNTRTKYPLSNYATIFKPKLATHQNRLFLAYVSASDQKIRLNVGDGNNWGFCYLRGRQGRNNYSFTQKAASAPALASYQRRFWMSWVSENDGRINVAEWKPGLAVVGTKKATTKVRSRKLPASFQPKGDIAMSVSTATKELVLAFSTEGGGLKTIAVSLTGDWTKRTWTEINVLRSSGNSEHPPSLFCHNDRMICSRENES